MTGRASTGAAATVGVSTGRAYDLRGASPAGRATTSTRRERSLADTRIGAGDCGGVAADCCAGAAACELDCCAWSAI